MNKIEKLVAKAAALPDEAKKLLLLKVRKGTDATITLAQTLHLVELVGGDWALEAGFVAMKGVDSKTGRPFTDEIHTARSDGEDWINDCRAGYKDKEISELPSHAQAGDRFITEVSPVGKNAYDWLIFTFIQWSTVYGIRINMPGGQSALFLPDGSEIARAPYDAYVAVSSAKPYEHGVLYDIKRWLKDETDYKTRVCQLLDMEEHVPAAQRTRDNTGCCPVCFREMKLKPGTTIMVLHGFKRPHHAGYLVGNCYGVGRPAYEISSEGVTDYIKNMLLIELSNLEMSISDVEGNALDAYPNTWEWQGKPIKRDHLRFEEARRRYRDALEREHEYMTRHITLYRTFVDEWKPRELPREGGPPRKWLNDIVRKIK